MPGDYVQEGKYGTFGVHWLPRNITRTWLSYIRYTCDMAPLDSVRQSLSHCPLICPWPGLRLVGWLSWTHAVHVSLATCGAHAQHNIHVATRAHSVTGSPQPQTGPVTGSPLTRYYCWHIWTDWLLDCVHCGAAAAMGISTLATTLGISTLAATLGTFTLAAIISISILPTILPVGVNIALSHMTS